MFNILVRTCVLFLSSESHLLLSVERLTTLLCSFILRLMVFAMGCRLSPCLYTSQPRYRLHQACFQVMDGADNSGST